MTELYETGYIEHLRQIVANTLPRWNLPPASDVSLLTVSENATFLISDDQSQPLCVIRVHRQHYHTLAEIESELSWIQALRKEQVITTPRPIPLTSGALIASFDDGEETRHMVAFEFALGTEPSTDQSLVSDFRQLGAITARLHEHARHWTPPSSFTRKIWNFDTTIGEAPHWGHWQHCSGLIPTDKEVLMDTVALIKEQLSHYGEEPERFGLIHADLRLANLLVSDKQLAVIDFDDCGIGWYVYDFAAAISFVEEDPQIPDLLQAWVSGYREVTELNEDDEALIPTFIMLRRLMLTAWLQTHSETPTAQELSAGFIDGTLRMARHLLLTGSPLDLQPGHSRIRCQH